MRRPSSSELKERIARLRSRVERSPTNSNLLQELGKAYLKAGVFDEAESAYRRSIEMDPTDPWAHLFLGNLHYTREQYSEALLEFDRGRALAPDVAMTYVCMADVYRCMDDLKQAGEYYRKAVAIDPEDETARKNLDSWLASVGPDEPTVD